MKPSVANYEDPMSVDLVYRQDKCISLDNFNSDGLDPLDYVDLDCTEDGCYGGKISCLKACQALNTTFGYQYQLAFIREQKYIWAEGANGDHFCTCATYASLPPILKGFRIFQP